MLHSQEKKRKNAPIPKFPSHNTNGFMHAAVLLPLLFAFSPCRDNVHPCLRQLFVSLSHPLSVVHFPSASDSSGWPNCPRSCTVIPAAANLFAIIPPWYVWKGFLPSPWAREREVMKLQ